MPLQKCRPNYPHHRVPAKSHFLLRIFAQYHYYFAVGKSNVETFLVKNLVSIGKSTEEESLKITFFDNCHNGNNSLAPVTQK